MCHMFPITLSFESLVQKGPTVTKSKRAQMLWNCSRLETLLLTLALGFLAQHYGLSPSLQPTAS